MVTNNCTPNKGIKTNVAFTALLQITVLYILNHRINIDMYISIHNYAVKSANVVTSIKQLPVLKGNFFLVLSYNILYESDIF